jgi:hypothetical protein
MRGFATKEMDKPNPTNPKHDCDKVEYIDTLRTIVDQYLVDGTSATTKCTLAFTETSQQLSEQL